MNIPASEALRRGLRRIHGATAAIAEIGALPSAEHRPWPLPSRPWIMAQTWNRLLFAHWPVPFETLRPLIPPALALEQFGGHAWLGITPFVLTGLRPRGGPAIPGLSDFHEINVRTYVSAGGKAGVYFFSLDADSAIAVSAARVLYSLPYFRARFAVTHDSGGAVTYTTDRTDGRAQFSAVYRPVGGATRAGVETLAAWLTERYCLYAEDRRGILYRTEIHHAPWLLRTASADIRRNTMTAPLGFNVPDVAPLLHYADKLHVHVWAPEKLRATVSIARTRSPGRAAVSAAVFGAALAVLRMCRRRRQRRRSAGLRRVS
jgi:uncharacterized protein YqjF (DUF2071 family)